MEDNVYYNNWVNKAKEKIEHNRQIGEVFELKELFDKLEWDTLETKKSSFGKYFAERVGLEIDCVVKVDVKKGAGKYKKIK